jgi:hypothetical protein
LGAAVEFDPQPLAIHEVFNRKRDARGHFVSLLYACTLTSPLDEASRADGATLRPGDWVWHRGCPPDLIAQHEIYRPHIDHAAGKPPAQT